MFGASLRTPTLILWAAATLAAFASSPYDGVILSDHPAAFWRVSAQAASEPDLTGHGFTGTYPKGIPSAATLPNGDAAADFNGSTQYLTIPSNSSFSIPTTHNLTWEAWIRPDVLQFPNQDQNGGYVAYMGKCASYSPTCEWEARMYSLQTTENPNRPNRLSAYVFNPQAGLGAGADWQPAAGVIQSGEWLHVVGEYTTQTAPSACQNTSTYPGSINIWVNGVEWDQAIHGQTGCMSQFDILPQANGSPLNIGTMAFDSYFQGAIGKVAIYNYLLTQAQIAGHYAAMTGRQPGGSCTDTCAFTANITLQTSPAGLGVSFDGGAFAPAPVTEALLPGTSHSIATQSPQSGGTGTQYAFANWSDSQPLSHIVTVPAADTTYTANFNTQYQLTISASPAAGGSVNATPSSTTGYYNAGTSVQLTASPNAGFQFGNWTGGLSGGTNPQSLTMTAPRNVTANFSVSNSPCSFTLSPGSASLPATGTSTVETCPNGSGQPSCGVTPEIPRSFTVTPGAACGAWTATSSNPEFLKITSGANGNGPGTVSFALVNNTHNGQQSYSIAVTAGGASASYPVTEAGSGDSQVYREVYALYEQLLGRDPDAAGFAFWTGTGGAGLGQMADSFLTSPEAYNTDFAVMATYQAATGAPPTFAQYTAAAAALRANTQTVPGLFNALIPTGFTAPNLYQNLLGRAPGGGDTACVNSGVATCFQTIIGYPSNVTPVGNTNNEFQNTGTFRGGPDHSNGLYVKMVYFVTLSRDPDPAGFTFWTGIANSGGPGLLFQGNAGFGTRLQILGPGTPNQGFIGSPEFQGLFAN